MIRLFILVLLVNYSYALTEEELVHSIVNHFPLIEEASLKLESSRNEVIAARGAFDHKLKIKSRNAIEEKYDNSYIESTIEKQTTLGGLSLMAGHRQGRGLFPAYDGKYETSGAGEIFAGFTLPLLRNLQTDEMRTDLLIAKLDKNIAKAELELKKNIYIHKGLSLYYKWLFSNQKVKIREDVLSIAESRQEMLEKKFSAGDIDRLKLTDNKRSIDKRKDELAKARLEQRDARTELALYYRDQTGLQKDLGIEKLPVDDIKPLSDQSFEQKLLPQLQIIENELKILDSRKNFYSQSKLPGLGIEVLGARELSPNDPYDQDRLVIGVRFDYPLENRKAEGKTVSSEYKYLALKKQRDFLHDRLKREYEFSVEVVNTSKQRWSFTSEEFKKTLVIAQAERTRWNQGASDLYIVNLREQDAAEADIKRWTVWYEYHQSILDARLYSARLAPVN
jgi:outer membrane protein, heavy metal efflux system